MKEVFSVLQAGDAASPSSSITLFNMVFVDQDIIDLCLLAWLQCKDCVWSTVKGGFQKEAVIAHFYAEYFSGHSYPKVVILAVLRGILAKLVNQAPSLDYGDNSLQRQTMPFGKASGKYHLKLSMVPPWLPVVNTRTQFS